MPEPTNGQQSEQQLLQQLYPTLMLIARRYLPESDAKDVVQETCQRFITKLKKGEIINYPHAYIRGILIKVIQEFKRQKQRYSPGLDLNDEPAESFEAEYIQQEEKVIIRKCFQSLDPFCQRLLYLHFVDGESFNSLEKKLNKSHNALHHRCKKCLKIFVHLLRKNGII